MRCIDAVVLSLSVFIDGTARLSQLLWKWTASPESTTAPAALPSGSSDLTLDYGFYKPVQIGDFVWNDLNTNGLQDSGEPGIQDAVNAIRAILAASACPDPVKISDKATES